MRSSISSSRRAVWLGALAACAAGVAGSAARVLPELAVDADWNTGAAQVLFVGSSHVAAAVDATALARPAGVVAFPGMSVELAASVLEAHRRRWPGLEVVVLEVDEFTLLGDPVAAAWPDLTHLCDRLALSFWNLPGSAAPWRRAGAALRGCAVPLLGPRHRLSLPRLRDHLVGGGDFFSAPERARSWTETDVALSPQVAALRIRFLEGLVAAHPDAAARNLAAIARFAAAAHRRGWRLALLSLPQHAFYRELRSPRWDEAIASAVAAARRGAGRDLAWWDLRAHPELPDTAFENQDHLNAAGAAELAPLLDALVAGEPAPARPGMPAAIGRAGGPRHPAIARAAPPDAAT
jgi:hypothetical protein